MTKFPFDKERLIQICRENDVAMVGIFGSMVTGKATDESDIDLVVRFSRRKSLLDLVRLERTISEALGQNVDLLTEAAISPYLRESITKSLQVIYEAR